MDIYIVKQGDTLQSIAQQFDISVKKLTLDNGINESDKLVVGQTLVIAYPAEVYTVKEGDSLESIAVSYQVTVLQLLRNNPVLANREYIYPGETLVISYHNNKGSRLVSGYTYPFIRDNILKKTLPNLTYLLMFNYRFTGSGELLGSDEDIAVIETAADYSTSSILVLTAFTATGEIYLPAVYEILLNQQAQNKLIENLLVIIETKGYSGVNLAFQFINTTNQMLYLNFLTNVANSLHPAGYSVFITINPGLNYNGTEVTFEEINYAELSKVADGLLFLSYDWGSTDRPPFQFSIITTPSLLDYIISQVPLDKIRIELPTLGYDWQLPYLEGITKANALNYDSVLALARLTKAEIFYDESTLSAYFEYIDLDSNQHIVWFKDARSVDSYLQILQSYGIKGIGIWNIMFYFTQMWLVINTQYEIEKL